MQNNTKTEKKRIYRRLTNVSLLVFGVVMAVSGLYIQIHYHMQKSDCLAFSEWVFVHRWSALIFALIIIAHVALHLKWYKIVFEKRLLGKNRVTMILTLTMIIVSLLGVLSWILPIQLNLRHTLIEIHDKLGVAFMVVMFCHVIKRWKWWIDLR